MPAQRQARVRPDPAIDAAVQELLRYTRGVECGRLESLEQVPPRLDGERLRASKLDSGGLTRWQGVAPVLPYLGLGGMLLLMVPWPGTGRWFDALRPTLTGWAYLLADRVEELFGWTRRLSFLEPDLFQDWLLFDPGWGPFLWSTGFAVLVALVIGPTRSTWNRLLVGLDALRR